MRVLFLNSTALFLCFLSALIFYLGCPNQQWLERRLLSFYPMLSISLFLLMPAWVLLNMHLSALSSSFTIFSVLMLLLGCLPFVARYKRPMTNKITVNSGLKKGTSVNYRPQWWLRIVGILVLAFPLAMGLAGLFAFLSPGPITNDAKTQLVMWMITPLVLLALSLIFFSKNLLRTYVGLLSMNGAVYLLLWFIKEGV